MTAVARVLTIDDPEDAVMLLQGLAQQEEKKTAGRILPKIAKAVNVSTVEDQISLNGWLFINSPYKYHWLCAGIGVGKSYLLARYMLRRVLENWETVGLACANTNTQLTQSTMPHFFKLLEDAGLEEGEDWVINKAPPEDWEARNLFRRGYRDVISIKVAVGQVAHILTRTLEAWKAIRGVTIGWAVCDEIADTKEKAWTEITQRLRCPLSHKLQILVAGIPDLPGDNWTWEEFSTGDPTEYRVTFQSTTEAKHLTWGYVKSQLSRLDPLRALQQIFARIVIDQTGRAYSSYREGVNNQERFAYDPWRPLFFCWDFNILSQSPISAVLFQEHEVDGVIHVQVIDEIVLPNADTAKACHEFLARYGEKHKSEVWVFGDSSGLLSQTISEFKVIKECLWNWFKGRLFIPKIKRNPRVDSRVGVVNGKLRSGLGTVTLWVSPRCKELILDFKKVVPDPRKESGGGLDKKDKQRTHCSDALGYGIMIRFPLESTQPSKNQLKAAV